MSRFFVLVASVLFAGAAASPCSSFSTCSDCIGQGLFCGWCSPAPTVFNNGTLGSQCQDQHDAGWHCNHLYSTDQCKQGYTCNQTSGTCNLAPAGEGDTKENCEKHCTKIKPPSGLSVCDATTLQCSPCKDYCRADSDCPSSYCSNGLCHGSSCEQEIKCNSTCSADTPDAIVGTWRGLQMQHGFPLGEFDYKFQKRAAGPQVTFRGPSGGVSTGSLTSDAASGGKGLTLTYSSGPLKGSSYAGAYMAWEPSPSTEQFAFYFGLPNGEAPTGIEQAMNGTGMSVYVLSRCKGHGADSCNFASVFPAKRLAAASSSSSDDLAGMTHEEAVAAFRRLTSGGQRVGAGPADPCTVHDDCSECVDDKSTLCGWCSTKVVYADGRAGSQCAGFDASGKPLGWQCAGKFSKDGCSDHGCDWTDIKQPKCKVCNDTTICSLTADECEKACKAPEAQFQCDSATKKCIPCAESYCTTNAQCPGSYCQITGVGPWSCHGAIPGGCSSASACAGACNSTETYYVCDKYAGQCLPANKTTPGADTHYNCQHACRAARPTGTWRGIEVSQNFTRGEWDVTFYDDNTLHWRQPDGTVVKSQVSGADVKAAEAGAVAITGEVVTGSSAGKLFDGLFQIDTQGDDGLVYLLTWGQGAKGTVSTFDQAMTQSMFVMTSCNPGSKLCDYSSAVVA